MDNNKKQESIELFVKIAASEDEMNESKNQKVLDRIGVLEGAIAMAKARKLADSGDYSGARGIVQCFTSSVDSGLYGSSATLDCAMDFSDSLVESLNDADYSSNVSKGLKASASYAFTGRSMKLTKNAKEVKA